MVHPGTARLIRFAGLTSLPLMAGLALVLPVRAQDPFLTDPTGQPGQVQPVDPTDPNNLRPLSQQSSLLSIQGGERLLNEADAAISAQNYNLAAKKLKEARRVFNQLSNFNQRLASSFSGIDNRISDSHRSKALETAQMRDRATYQLALVHRAQNQAELAVPLLVQIISSQNPTRDLGKKAYQQLFELGFADSPYPRPRGEDSQSTSSVPR